MNGTPIREDQRGRSEIRDGGGPAVVPDRRLGRNQRLTKSEDFSRIFDYGRSSVGRYMVMWTGAGAGGICRLGVIASKRSFRRAVDRARAKRMMREAFRLNRYKFAVDRDVVLIGRKKILQASLSEIAGDLLDLAARDGILKTSGDR